MSVPLPLQAAVPPVYTTSRAIEVGAPAPVLTAALCERFTSRGEADFADRVLYAIRLGSHQEGRG